MNRILLLEDDVSLIDGLVYSLKKNEFDVEVARTVCEAKQYLSELDRYDLLILDVTLPDGTGFDVCERVRKENQQIPIIFLTASDEEVSIIRGLDSGGDDYITKPFNMEVLKLRINKIIEMNVKRQEIFNQDIKIEPSRITITPLDQQLVEKAIQIVEDNISETEFSVEELASSLNISRSYFYKKMIKITGKKPIEFIRTIRMKRAQQLLTESQMQVSEIAYTLGYNSPKIFSKHFKEEFNISPSEFIRQQAE